MLILALPVLLALALLVATLLGHITPAQCAAGLGLLLAPGANSYAPLLREILGKAALPPKDPRRGEVTVSILDSDKVTGLARLAEQWAKDPALRKATMDLLEFLHGLKTTRKTAAPPVPRPGELTLLALFLGALCSCVAPARRNEARATFTAAQADQVAAAQDLAALDREHQRDLALEIPRSGVTRVRAAVTAWRGRRADVLATSERLAREAAEARPTMEGSGDPAKLEELAQRAKEGAAQLRAAITGLRAYGAEQLRELAPQADGGVR